MKKLIVGKVDVSPDEVYREILFVLTLDDKQYHFSIDRSKLYDCAGIGIDFSADVDVLQVTNV